jgi:predicted NodU family carbamoyl transferase
MNYELQVSDQKQHSIKNLLHLVSFGRIQTVHTAVTSTFYGQSLETLQTLRGNDYLNKPFNFFNPQAKMINLEEKHRVAAESERI